MITIFTEPSLNKFYNLKRLFINYLKRKINKKIPYHNGKIITGHFAVVRSLMDGFGELNYKYNYNPKRKKEIYDHVHVLANVKALKQAIKLKKRGVIKHLSAGPNIAVDIKKHHKLLASKEIDTFIQPSEWTKDYVIEECDNLKEKTEVCPAGIDIKFWDQKASKKTKILIYSKRPQVSLELKLKKILEENLEEVEIIRYGFYDVNLLKEVLSISKFVIYLVEQESQGIAFFEIWASNTPTAVWDPGNFNFKGKNYFSSSCPYICDDNGFTFFNFDDFRQKYLTGYLENKKYKPYKWVEKNGTDAICTKRFINLTRNNYVN
jgi:predicted  nucleic acid-binding Zn-ribbon protein